MTPVIFINCSTAPFIDLIMNRMKQYETRTKNTMKSLMKWALGTRILLAETGNGSPVVRCSAVIDQVIAVYTAEKWEQYRPFTQIEKGSRYDWKPETKVKYLYHLSDVKPLAPFNLPDTTIRHGRVWAEYEERSGS